MNQGIMRIVVAFAAAALVCAGAPAKRPVAYGAIEVGASGIKAGIFTFSENVDGLEVRQVVDVKDNPQPILYIKDGSFSQEGLKVVTDSVASLYGPLKERAKEKGLNPVYFAVGSSSVATAANAAELAKEIRTATGLDLGFVRPEEEAQLALISSVPAKRFGESVLIDIGGGNTKLGYMVTSLGRFRGAEVRWGSRSVVREVGTSADLVAFRASVDKLIAEKTLPQYDEVAQKNSSLTTRGRIYWVGGAAWAVATVMHLEASLSRSVSISRTDIDRFLDRVGKGTWNQLQMPALGKTVTAKQRAAIQAKAQTNLDELKSNDAFTPQSMIAGASLMRSYLSRSPKNVVVMWPRYGQWLYGYALTKFEENR